MKLVNIHKPMLILFLSLLGFTATKAQVWSLQQCIDTVQVHNKNLCMAQSRIPMDGQKQKQAEANLLSTITLNIDYKYLANLPYQLLSPPVFGSFETLIIEVPFGLPRNISMNFKYVMSLYNPLEYEALKSGIIASELVELDSFITEEQALFELSNFYFAAQILRNQLAFITNAKILLAEAVIQDQSIIDNESLPAIYISPTKMQYLWLSYELNKLMISTPPPPANLFGTFGKRENALDKIPNDFFNYYPINCLGIQFTNPLFNDTIPQYKTNREMFKPRSNTLQFDMFANGHNTMQADNSKLQKLVYRQAIEPTIQFDLPVSIYVQTLLHQHSIANITNGLFADTPSPVKQQLVYRYDKEKPTNVWADTIQLKDLSVEWLYSGTFEPNKETKLSADIQGRVDEVFVDVGDKITKGETLVQIDNTLLKLQLQSAEIQIDGLEADVKRYTKLANTDAVHRNLLEKAELELKLANVHNATLLEQINKTTIKAPFNGVISAKLTEQGAFASQGLALLQITDISKLKFIANIPDFDLNKFSTGDSYSLSVDMYPDIPLQGKISSIGSRTKVGSSYSIQFSLNNTANLDIKAGMLGKAHIRNVIEDEIFSVPCSLLIGTTQRPQVYLIILGNSPLKPIPISQKNEAINLSAFKERDVIVILNCNTGLCKPPR